MNTLIVSGNLNSLNQITEYVIEITKKVGLNEIKSYKLRLAIDEIATNIIIHGYQEAGLEGNIKLHSEINPNCLTFILEDTGTFYDPTCKPPQQNFKLPLTQRPLGGLGVHLAINGVDNFIYERKDNINRNILQVRF